MARAVSTFELCLKMETVHLQLDSLIRAKRNPLGLVKASSSLEEYELKAELSFIYLWSRWWDWSIEARHIRGNYWRGLVSFQLYRIRINRGTCLVARARNNRGEIIRRVARLAYVSWGETLSVKFQLMSAEWIYVFFFFLFPPLLFASWLEKSDFNQFSKRLVEIVIRNQVLILFYGNKIYFIIFLLS